MGKTAHVAKWQALVELAGHGIYMMQNGATKEEKDELGRVLPKFIRRIQQFDSERAGDVCRAVNEEAIRLRTNPPKEKITPAALVEKVLAKM